MVWTNYRNVKRLILVLVVMALIYNASYIIMETLRKSRLERKQLRYSENVRPGISKEEVRRLLGTPDKIGPLTFFPMRPAEGKHGQIECWEYGLYSQWIIICFDSDDRVVSTNELYPRPASRLKSLRNIFGNSGNFGCLVAVHNVNVWKGQELCWLPNLRGGKRVKKAEVNEFCALNQVDERQEISDLLFVWD
jgi:hypothetical protein